MSDSKLRERYDLFRREGGVQMVIVEARRVFIFAVESLGVPLEDREYLVLMTPVPTDSLRRHVVPEGLEMLPRLEKAERPNVPQKGAVIGGGQIMNETVGEISQEKRAINVPAPTARNGEYRYGSEAAFDGQSSDITRA
jgi:hypothetical protein